MSNPSEGLSTFFDIVWKDTEGFVYLPTKDENNVWKKAFYKWPLHKHHVIDHVLSNASSNRDVYFSPVIWSVPKLSRDFIKGTHVLWADFDGNAPDWTADVSPGAAPGPPSIVIQSSTESHQHVYWELDEFNTDLSYVENTNRAIAYSYSADTSGWDVEQILRPPYSTNYKHGLPVLINSIELQGSYSASLFTSFEPVKVLLANSIDDTDLPDPIEVIGKYEWDEQSRDLLYKEINKGGQSSALMRVGYKCAELGLSEAESYSLLLFVDDRLGKFKGRDDRRKQLLNIISKAMQKYPHPVAKLTFDGLKTATAVEVNARYIYGFNDFLISDFKADWAIENLMPEQGIGIISSAPNVGKTQLIFQLGINHALHTEFIGYNFTRAAKGIIFSLEMGAIGLHRLVSTMAAGYTQEEIIQLQSNVLIIPAGEPMPLSNVKVNKFFEKIIDENKPDWIAIDSLEKVLTGKMSDDESARELFNYLAGMRAKYGFYCWLVHHNRKAQGDNKKPHALDDIYGSVFISSNIDVALSLWKETPASKNILINNTKNRYAEISDPYWVHRTEHLNFKLGKLDEVPPSFKGLVNGAKMGNSTTAPNRVSRETGPIGLFGGLTA